MTSMPLINIYAKILIKHQDKEYSNVLRKHDQENQKTNQRLLGENISKDIPSKGLLSEI